MKIDNTLTDSKRQIETFSQGYWAPVTSQKTGQDTLLSTIPQNRKTTEKLEEKEHVKMMVLPH